MSPCLFSAVAYNTCYQKLLRNVQSLIVFYISPEKLVGLKELFSSKSVSPASKKTLFMCADCPMSHCSVITFPLNYWVFHLDFYFPTLFKKMFLMIVTLA